MRVTGLTIQQAFQWSVINTCLGFVAVNAGIFAMRHLCGRRTILILGAATNGVWMLGLAISNSIESSSEVKRNCVIAFICLYLFFHNATMGDASNVVAAELVSTRLRAYTFGSAMAFSWLLSWIVTFCTPYFINPSQLNWVGYQSY